MLLLIFFPQRNERKSKINRSEKPTLTRRNDDRVIHKFTECRPLRVGMDAGEWSSVWHSLSKAKLRFFVPDVG